MDKRTQKIQLRLSELELTTLKTLAVSQGLTLSDFIRNQLLYKGN